MRASAGSGNVSLRELRQEPTPSAGRSRSSDSDGRGYAHNTRQNQRRLPLPVTLFCLSVLVPWTPQIAGVELSPYRIVLLVTIIPCLSMWIAGKAGRIRIADIALMGYAAWCFLSLLIVHGPEFAIKSGGVLFIETIGAYLLARCYIRDAQDFYTTILWLFRGVAFLLPLAVYEAVMNQNIARELFASIMPSLPDFTMEARLGLRRVQAVFDHPILFGVVTGSILAPVHLVLGYGQSFVKRWFRTGIVFATSFLSLSAGPLSALAAQGMLLGWNWFFRRNPARWKIMWGLIALMYVFISMASNQSVPAFWLTHFSFDEASAYYRLLIWDYGSNSALNHPFFGVGYNEWDRPSWMPPSIDMFWLIHAVFYGIPAALLMLTAFFSSCLSLGFKKGISEDPKLNAYRTAYLISMSGFFLVGWTVHFWNSTFVLFMFLMGSGAWLLDAVPQRKYRIGRTAESRNDASRLTVSSAGDASKNAPGRRRVRID